jgi:hypothetical protein
MTSLRPSCVTVYCTSGDEIKKTCQKICITGIRSSFSADLVTGCGDGMNLLPVWETKKYNLLASRRLDQSQHIMMTAD